MESKRRKRDMEAGGEEDKERSEEVEEKERGRRMPER